MRMSPNRSVHTHTRARAHIHTVTHARARTHSHTQSHTHLSWQNCLNLLLVLICAVALVVTRFIQNIEHPVRLFT
eukprot:COSAG02_NODE_62341_length_266_cov_0.616766_1_plen_74_part_10